MIKTCKNCKNEYNARKSIQNFCSRKCTYEYRSKYLVGENASNYKNGNRTKQEIKCDNCGNIVLKEKQHIDKWKNNFCNRKCQIEFYKKEENKLKGESNPKYSKVDVRCEWCGKTYKTYKSTKDIVRFCSKACRNNWQSEIMKGSNHYNWNGGSSQKRHLDMSRREYKNWRRQVFERDQFTCKICGDNKGGNLNAHHIKPYSEFPELRYELENGITLCEKCHTKIHTKK